MIRHYDPVVIVHPYWGKIRGRAVGIQEFPDGTETLYKVRFNTNFKGFSEKQEVLFTRNFLFDPSDSHGISMALSAAGLS